MKSDFSRFLHHTMSYSGGKPDTASALSYSGLTRISRWKNFANWFDLDTPIKSECDTLGKNASTGRSMVEMLGVLAIIGVLSIGAIAGYSKAMMKYKLNLVTNSANQLIATIIEKNHLNGNSFTTSTPTTKTFINAGWIPDGFTADPKIQIIFTTALEIGFGFSGATTASVSVSGGVIIKSKPKFAMFY